FPRRLPQGRTRRRPSSRTGSTRSRSRRTNCTSDSPPCSWMRRSKPCAAISSVGNSLNASSTPPNMVPRSEANLPPDVANVVVLGFVPVHLIKRQRGAAAQGEAAHRRVDFALHLGHGFGLVLGRLEQPTLAIARTAQVRGDQVHPVGPLAG